MTRPWLVRIVADMQQLIAAMQAKDVDGVVACFAEDGELQSPISRRVAFRGREQIREVLQVVYATVGPIGVTEVVGDGDRRVLVVASSVNGQPLDETMLLRLDGEGRVAELRLYVRAMPQLVTFAAAIGPPLARRRSRVRALALWVMFSPLAAMVRMGEPLGIALTGAGTPLGRR